MSLIESMMEPFSFMTRTKVDDPVGGYLDTYQEGVSFRAAVIKNSTTQAVVAEKSGISEIFTIVTYKTMSLDYHDVIKRLSDGEIFRVTSKTEDSTAPVASSVPIAKVNAEKWVLPT